MFTKCQVQSWYLGLIKVKIAKKENTDTPGKIIIAYFNHIPLFNKIQ